MFSRIHAALVAHSKSRSRVGLYERLDAAIAGAGLTADSRVLNVGAGGEIAARLAAAGLRPVSIDFDPNRLPDVVADVHDLAAFDDNAFDAVFLMEVLEHLVDPPRALAEVRRVLADGGVLIGSTPFLLGVHDAPHDYYRYTEYGLNYLLSGFGETTVKPRNGYFDAVYALLTRPLIGRTKRERRRAIPAAVVVFATRPLFGVLNKILSEPAGPTGYFFTAVKRPAAGVRA